MREWLINRLEISNRTVLNRKIPKKAFFIQADLSKSEKGIFTSQVEGIYLLSVMNQQSTNIPVFKDEEFNYSEVLWIFVEIRNNKNIERVISAVHNSIPNPVVLTISSPDDQILMSTCHKRLNKNDKTKVVVEQPIITEWFNPKDEDTAYYKLLNSLVISNLSFENLHSIYKDIHRWIKCEEAIRLVGSIPISKEKREEAINILSNVESNRKEVEQLKQEQKRQIDFGSKMNLHIKIKQFNQQFDNLLQNLKELC